MEITGDKVKFPQDNNIEANRQLKALVGASVRLLPLESIDEIVVGPGTVSALVTKYKVDYRYDRLRVTEKGMRLIVWSKSHTITDKWDCQQITAWDTNFIPFDLPHRTGRDPSAWLARIRHERQAYRPGQSRFPLDNYERTKSVAPQYNPPKMERHWTERECDQ